MGGVTAGSTCWQIYALTSHNILSRRKAVYFSLKAVCDSNQLRADKKRGPLLELNGGRIVGKYTANQHSYDMFPKFLE